MTSAFKEPSFLGPIAGGMGEKKRILKLKLSLYGRGDLKCGVSKAFWLLWVKTIPICIACD